MHWLAYAFVLILLIPDWAWSGGFRGSRGAIGGSGGSARSGFTAAVRPRLGTFSRSVVGNPIFIPHSHHFGTHFGRGPFVRFGVPGPFVIRRFHPPFIYYHPYSYLPWWNYYGYSSYPGASIIEIPAASDSALRGSMMPGMTEEPFAPPALLERPANRTVAGQLAPFDPTPQEVVDRMLTLAGVKDGDLVYDLGSGDGRVLIAAAKKYGVRAVGFELDAGLVKLARENIKQENLEHHVELRQQDFLTADLSAASVVTLYLSHDGNSALKPLLLRQLRPGARIVSYTFDMGDWPPRIAESYRDGAGNVHTLYFWEIPQAALYSENPS
jgi:SAM-dependent methyltransferase